MKTEKKRKTMPQHHSLLYERKKFFYIFMLVASLVMFVFSAASTDASPTGTNTSNVSISSLQVSSPVTTKDYQTIATDSTLSTSTIILNGKTTNLVELPSESIAVKLPDDRLAIKSADETSILPQGSTLTYYQDKPVISVPEQQNALGVSTVVVSPLQNFTVKTNFIQNIQGYNVYSVQVVFFELARTNPTVALANYHIYWGDGSNDVYTAETISVTHVYQQSGTYLLTITATDALGFTSVATQQYTINYEGHLTHSYLWAKTNKGPLTAVTASFGLLAIGLLAFTETGRYRILVLFSMLLPFYAKMSKEDVLDQFVRGQIYGFIKTNPGAHYNQIRRQIGVKNGTLSYHLGVLEKTELIKSRREGLKYRAFYPTGMNFPKKERFRLTDLQIQIIASITNSPGMTQKEIARLLDQKPQTVNYNIKVLEQAGLIDMEKKGRKTICYPAPDAEHTGE
jgi:DNA-binding MarR family transcriptional regulator